MGRLLQLILLAAAGCSPGYVLQQGAGQVRLLLARRPVEEVLRDPATPPEARERLELIAEARRWGERELGLAHTDSYETYVDLHGQPVSWLVTACPPDSLTCESWWFPVVGRVPYLGFFDRDDALARAAELTADGLDAHVRPVPAYSTLGWFSDPVFSTFVEWPAYAAVDTVLHETTHATVWIPGSVPINEALAGVVGEEGARRFLVEKFGPASPQVRELDASRLQDGRFRDFVMRLGADLRAAYALDLPRREKLELKAAIVGRAKRRYRAMAADFTSGFLRNFDRLEWNNALVASIAVYHDEEGQWRRVLEAAGGDLRAFLAVAKGIRDDASPKEALARAAAKPVANGR